MLPISADNIKYFFPKVLPITLKMRGQPTL